MSITTTMTTIVHWGCVCVCLPPYWVVSKCTHTHKHIDGSECTRNTGKKTGTKRVCRCLCTASTKHTTLATYLVAKVSLEGRINGKHSVWEREWERCSPWFAIITIDRQQQSMHHHQQSSTNEHRHHHHPYYYYYYDDDDRYDGSQNESTRADENVYVHLCVWPIVSCHHHHHHHHHFVPNFDRYTQKRSRPKLIVSTRRSLVPSSFTCQTKETKLEEPTVIIKHQVSSTTPHNTTTITHSLYVATPSLVNWIDCLVVLGRMKQTNVGFAQVHVPTKS